MNDRRVFLRAALQGLSVMMVGCGRDQGPRPFLDGLRSGPGEGSGPGTGGDLSGGSAGDGDGAQGGADGGAGGTGEPGEAFPQFGALGEPNDLGVRLPPGYQVRLLAVSGSPVRPEISYVWPIYPDGGACFALNDGGWIYVVNSEVNSGGGGVAALVFSSEGEIVDAYSIARGTSMNCQGGVTPSGAWLTCEEVSTGRVLECDPLGQESARERLALGLFPHEGLAYDVEEHHLYMTEDLTDGGLYRFVPDRVVGGSADLSAGRLQIARGNGEGLEWVDVPDPTLQEGVATRYQVEGSAAFNGGEGIWYQDRRIVFTTKGDDRVWSYDIGADRLSIIYERATALNPILSGVDCVVGTAGGELLIAEDLGDMQIVVILPNGTLKPLLQVDGQASSEITGLAFSPDGTRLYFSSQRGGPNGQGLTYEVTGPFPPPA